MDDGPQAPLRPRNPPPGGPALRTARAGPGHAARPLSAHLRGPGRGAARRARRGPAGSGARVSLRLRLAHAAGQDRATPGRVRARSHRPDTAHAALPGRRGVSEQPHCFPRRPLDRRADHRRVRRESCRRAHPESQGQRRPRRQGRDAGDALPGLVRGDPQGGHGDQRARGRLRQGSRAAHGADDARPLPPAPRVGGAGRVARWQGGELLPTGCVAAERGSDHRASGPRLGRDRGGAVPEDAGRGAGAPRADLGVAATEWRDASRGWGVG